MSYQWKADEGVADGFRRIAGEELEAAIAGLSDPGVRGIEPTVHDVRKRCKKVRGLARLVRPGLGASYQIINGAARDAAAQISPIRDAHAVLGSFDRLLASIDGDVPTGGLFAVRAELSRRGNEASQSVASHDAAVHASLEGLIALRALVADCEVDDDVDVVMAGLTTTYRRGAEAMVRARNAVDDEALHDWRKREKHLWYAARLLTPWAPAVLGPESRLLHVLSEDLGDDHDLAVLTDLIDVDPDAFGGEAATQAAADLAATARAALHEHAFGLGVQVYAESPKAFRRRFRTYWKTWSRHDGALPDGS